jgi:SAM-dependent methyltransferase
MNRRWPSLVCPRCRRPLEEEDAAARCPACSVRYRERDGILELTAGGGGQPGFDPHYFEALARMEQEHFWWRARRELILDVLRRRVPDLGERALFDIGCGSGGLLHFLAVSGVPVAGACDAYRESLQIVRRRLEVPLVLADAGRLPPLGEGLRLVSLFDVLEHVDDDVALLRWIETVLLPGGFLILTVPAHPFLFDEMDEIAHHRRRYRRRELREKLQAAGLEVIVLSHFMAPLLPLMVLVRALGRAFAARTHTALERRTFEARVIPVVNDLMLALLRSERFWMRRTSIPFGTSLLALARRPDRPAAA